MLAKRIKANQDSAIRKHWLMMEKHSSTWYGQSANKESDKRGSRALISVDGLWASEDDAPTTKLAEMVQIARTYFQDLHTPEPTSVEWATSQRALLGEVTTHYGPLPPLPESQPAPSPLMVPY